MPSSLVIHLTACLLLHLSLYLGNHLGNLESLRAEGFCLISHSQTESKAAETVMLLTREECLHDSWLQSCVESAGQTARYTIVTSCADNSHMIEAVGLAAT